MMAAILMAGIGARAMHAGAVRAPALARMALAPLRPAVSGRLSRGLSNIALNTRDDMRNIAIVAHVDHGKTSLVDAMLMSAQAITGSIGKDDRLMDSNDQVRRRRLHFRGTRPPAAPARPAGACGPPPSYQHTQGTRSARGRCFDTLDAPRRPDIACLTQYLPRISRPAGEGARHHDPSQERGDHLPGHQDQHRRHTWSR